MTSLKCCLFSNTYWLTVVFHHFILGEGRIQSDVFEYVLFYGGLSPFLCVWWGCRGEDFGGLVTYICKTYFCMLRKLFQEAKNEDARDVWEFQRSPSRHLSSMVERIFIPEDKTNMK